MRDLYKEGYQDATREVDQALTSALAREGDPHETIDLLITHLHSMTMRAGTDEHDAITFEDFLQSTGNFTIIKGGM